FITDRCAPFQNRDPNSPRGAESRRLPLPITGAAVLPDSPFEFLITAFDRPCGIESMSSIQPESAPSLLAQIGRFAKEREALVQQLRLTPALPTSGSQNPSHDVEIDAPIGVDEFPHFPPILLTGQRVLSVKQGSHFGHELRLC